MRTMSVAEMIAEKTRDAYSFGVSYGIREWTRIARFLLDKGYSPKAVEEILYSKYMRWAHDNSNSNAKMTLEKFKPYYEREKTGIDKMLAEEFGFREQTGTWGTWYL